MLKRDPSDLVGPNPASPSRSESGSSRLARIAAVAVAVAAAAGVAYSADLVDRLDLKYEHFRDRNGVVVHSPVALFEKRIGRFFGLSWEQEYDAVSGASRDIGTDLDGEGAGAVDAISGASRDESRLAGRLGLHYAHAGRTATAGVYASTENDYRSIAPSLAGSWDFADRNTTVSAGWSAYFDHMDPPAPFDRTEAGGDKRVQSVQAGVSQLLTPLTLVALTATGAWTRGYIGHPYTPIKAADGSMMQERLPRSRNAAAFAVQGIQGYLLADLLGSVNAEYRRYLDDWGIRSHTLDLKWSQHVTEASWIRLRTRLYAQDPAAFVRDPYQGDEAYRTTDIRFYRFRSLLLGAKFVSAFPESWGDRMWLPDHWDIGYDHLWRDTRGRRDLYQLFPSDAYYQQGTLLAGIGFDL